MSNTSAESSTSTAKPAPAAGINRGRLLQVLGVWFGVSAAVVGLLALIAPISWQWQLISFALIALATVFWVRRQSREDSSKSDVPDLNVRGAQYIGRILTVEDAIINGRGKVRVDDTMWSAEGEDAAKGARVKVTGVDGTVLVVVRADAS